jgi:hypothetical protein
VPARRRVAAALLGLARAERRRGRRPAWAYLPIIVLAAAFPLAPATASSSTVGRRRLQARRRASSRRLQDVSFRPTSVRRSRSSSASVTVAAGARAGRAADRAVRWVALLVHLAERMARALAELVRGRLRRAAVRRLAHAGRARCGC